ncbi:hypothetical protein M3J09_008974 [Ascochyta lentis]
MQTTSSGSQKSITTLRPCQTHVVHTHHHFGLAVFIRILHDDNGKSVPLGTFSRRLRPSYSRNSLLWFHLEKVHRKPRSL